MRLASYLLEHKFAIFLTLILLICQAVTDLALPTLMADIVDVGIMQSNVGFIVQTGIKMLAVALLGMVFVILTGFIAARTGAAIGRDLRSKLFSQVVAFGEGEVGNFSAASLITRGTNDIMVVQNVSIMLMRVVLYSPILAIGGIVMVMVTNPSMGWIVVAAVIAVAVVIGLCFSLAMPKFKIMQKLIDRVNLVAREMLTGLSVVRAFDREDYEEQRFDVASDHLRRTQLFTNRVMTFMGPSMMLIMNATSVAIVWFGSQYIDLGAIETGDMIAFITYAMVIVSSFLMIGMMAIMLPRAQVAAARIDEVLSCVPAVKDAEDAQEVQLAAARGAKIEFDHVSFRYDDSSENVLTDVSFVAQPGKTLAFVGGTGSGKSTILKLIERFYDATEGAVKIDDVDVRSIPQAQLRKQLGYVPQKAFLFSGTIATNIAYSNENMSDERIEEALEIAQAAEFVGSKPEGVDAEISQGGTNVSGGQRQRLAIARALATDARAFLFDDSFSALDYKTDAELRHQLDEHLQGVTRIIVAQRISTIMNADCIVVLDEGRVVGQGTHAQLLKSCEEYYEIAVSQLSEEELLKGGDVA